MASSRSSVAVSLESFTKREAEIRGRRPHEGVAAGVDRAGSLAHATGDAVAEQLVFRPAALAAEGIRGTRHLAFAGGREHAIGLQIRLELPDLVEHRVDVRDQIALNGESRQRCQFDDAEFVGLRACVVFARVSFGSGRVRAPLITRVAGAAESLAIGEGNRRRRFRPVADGRGAQERRRAVDRHRVGTAHAMPARITERQGRIHGALDLQQTVQHRILPANRQSVLLNPLLAAGTPTRRSGGAAEWRAFLGEGAAGAGRAITLGTRREPVHPQGHRGQRVT